MPTFYLAGLSVLAFAVILGYLFVRLPVIRWAFLPGSLASGMILLALGPDISGVFFPDYQLPSAYYQMWSQFPKQLINVVFACLFLARPVLPFRKMWRLAGPQVAFGQTLAWGQYMIGGLLTLLVLMPVFGVNPLSAALIEISFEGGHGTSSGLGPVFHQLGFPEGQELALGLATVSLITALVSGIILVHWGRRRHHIKDVHKQTARVRAYHRRIIYELRREGIRLRDHLNLKSIINHLILVAVAVGIGWLIYQGLLILEHYTLTASTGISILQYVPFFPICMFGGIVAHKIWKRLGWYVFRPLVELISAISLSILIATAVGTMSLNYIVSHMPVFVLLAASGIIWILFGFVFLAQRMFQKNWFQNGIVNMAQSMGMTATGLLFVHMVDPRDKTNTVESFGYKQLMFEPFVGGGIVTALSMPFIFTFGLMPFTLIAAGVCLAWLCLGLLLFGRR